MSEEWFKTIGEHWSHFLERDMPPQAPDVQVMAMKKAFAAGAISGAQLCIMERGDMEKIMIHVRHIAKLGQDTP